MYSFAALDSNIDTLRKKMYEAFKQMGSLTDPAVVSISQQLDELILMRQFEFGRDILNG